MNRTNRVMLAVLIVGLLVAPLLMAQQLPRSEFGWVSTKRLTATALSDLQGTLNVDGAATFGSTTATTGVATFAADVTQSDGDVTVADDLTVSAQTAITVTQGMTLTPTGSYQPIRSAGSVSFGVIADGVAGDMLVLINETNTTITISDTGTLKLSGNAALGQYDNVTLWSDGTNWVEVSQTDN